MPPIVKRRRRGSVIRPTRPSKSAGKGVSKKRKMSWNVVKSKRRKIGAIGGRRYRKPRKVVRGQFVGKFNKPKRMKAVLKFAKKGFEAKYEDNSTVTDPHCVYAGHGTSMERAFKAVWYAVYRQLMLTAGLTIKNWGDACDQIGGTSSMIYLYYRQSEGEAVVSKNSRAFMNNVGTILSWNDSATLFVDNVRNIYQTTNTDGKPVVFNRVTLYSKDTDGWPMAQINLEEFKVELDYFSTLKIQNRTAGATGETEIEVVDAQPLQGKIYTQTMWKNGFNIHNKNQDNTPSGVLNCIGGIIIATSSQLDVNLPVSITRKPPPGYTFGDKVKVANVVMEPGSIRYSKFKFSAEMLLNTWMQKLFYAGQGNTTVRILDFGKAEVVALEKALTIGAADTANIKIGYQIDQYVRAVGKASAAKAAALYSVAY